MSVHPVNAVGDATPREVSELTYRLALLCEARLRRCSVDWSVPAIVFDPDLTAQEETQFDRLSLVVRVPVVLTPSEFDAIRAMLPELRTFRGRTTTEWSALTAAQREANQIQWLRDLTDVVRALLRD